MLFYVRHGHREDEDLTKKLVDPKITELGKKASAMTGAFLRQVINSNRVDRVIIECSPFLRALLTGSEIAQQIFGSAECTIKVCNWVHELLIEPLFPSNPYKKMLLHQTSEEEISKAHLGGVKIDANKKERGRIYYPESPSAAHQRIEWHVNSSIE